MLALGNDNVFDLEKFFLLKSPLEYRKWVDRVVWLKWGSKHKTFDIKRCFKKLTGRKTLRSVDLSKQKSNDFMVGKILNKIRLKRYYLKTSDEFPLLSDKDREFLEKKIDKKCLDGLRRLWEDNSCHQTIAKVYVDHIKKECIKSKSLSDKIKLVSTLQEIKSKGVTLTFQLTIRCHR